MTPCRDVALTTWLPAHTLRPDYSVSAGTVKHIFAPGDQAGISKLWKTKCNSVEKHSETQPKMLKVDRAEFDAIMAKLIATPPKPVTPKRKVRKAKAKPAR